MSDVSPTVLGGCRLLGPFADPHDPLQRALSVQARALGLEVRHASGDGRRRIYRLEGEGMQPVHCSISGWVSDAPRAISEFTLQAACGLMALHGRARGQAEAIDLDYLTNVAASLVLTWLMASALGRLRVSKAVECSLSLPGAGLLCISQYLAGATAEEGAEQLPAGCSSARLRPPFIMLRHGSEALRHEVLAPVLAGEVVASFGMSEPNSIGSISATLKTRAHWCGDHLRLDGEKWFICRAEQAAFITVVARTGDGPVEQALTLFVVRRHARPGSRREDERTGALSGAIGGTALCRAGRPAAGPG